MANQLHSAPPFRAEHMGSLLRPESLLAVREKIRDTGISEEAAGLHAVEKETVRDVVKLQRDLGYKAVTSGEFNRTRFWGQMWDEFEGMVHRSDLISSALLGAYHLLISQAQSVFRMLKPPCSDSTTPTWLV